VLILRELKNGKPLRVRNVRLSGNHINFGRSPICSYQLENVGTVSRIQATLKLDTDGWWFFDGGLDKPSGAGCYVGDTKLIAPIPIAPGLKIQLFKGVDYEVTLEVVSEISESDILISEASTMEIPLFQMGDEIAQMRTSIDALAEQVAAQSVWIAEVVEKITLDFKQAIACEVAQLKSDLHPRLIEAERQNNQQDVLIKRVLTGLAAALVAVSGYNLSQGDGDSVRRGLDMLNMVLGLGGGAAIVIKNNQESDGNYQNQSR
jgi:pSer/pThr/pTyr-binding forkhead associated (FHA) protein